MDDLDGLIERIEQGAAEPPSGAPATMLLHANPDAVRDHLLDATARAADTGRRRTTRASTEWPGRWTTS
jgi:hypothetical protein